MNSELTAMRTRQPRLAVAIVAGGAAAGIIDAISAFITFGPRMPFGIACGLLGLKAFQGGKAIWLLGLSLHFLIAFTAAAVYCLASLKLTFLRTNFLVGAAYYGMTVFLFMSLVVLPLSALPRVGPFTVSDLLHGMVAQMFLIGLPIALSARLFLGAPKDQAA
jgi:hypothetical protein